MAEVRLYREGLAQALGRHPNISVVATAASSGDALTSVSDVTPDLVLVDVATPESVAAIGRTLAAAPGAKVVTLGVGDEEHDVLASAEAGAIGSVSREGSLDDLVAVIECTARGEAVCPPRIAGALFRRVAALARGRGCNPVQGHLTSRECQIVRLIDEGLCNKDIASRLCIEVATVKNHVHNILEKLQVHRRGEAAARVRGTLPSRGGAGQDGFPRGPVSPRSAPFSLAAVS